MIVSPRNKKVPSLIVNENSIIKTHTDRWWKSGDAHLKYSLEHKKHGEVNTCIQRATAKDITETVVYEKAGMGWDGQTYNGKKRGK